MKLPIPFKSDKKDKQEMYLALLLTDEKASAVILESLQGNVKIINTHEKFFSGSIETITQEELIEIIDNCISRAEEILPPNIETHKTVFGVKQSWIDEETKKIKKDNLSNLKKVCDSLDLTPIGFMIVSEAVIHLLQEDEGAPLSAILAEIGRKNVALTLLRGGKVLETVEGDLEGTAAATIDKLLKHFTVAVLPARIILFPTKDEESLSQQFIKHQWSKSLPFLHFPQITVLPHGYDAKAVTYGAAAQLGFEVTGISKDIRPQELTIISDPTPDKKEPEEDTSHHPKNENETSKSTIVAGNFGFVLDQDISDIPQSALPFKAEEEIEENEPDETDEKEEEGEPFEHHKREVPTSSSLHASERKKKTNIFAFLSVLKLPHMRIFSPSIIKNRGIILFLFILIVLIILGIGVVYYYFNQVKVTAMINIQPKNVEQTADITFSTDSPSDFSKKIVVAKQITASLDGNLTTDATGKKDVGEKAKGTITLYNSSDNDQQVSAGTTIKSSNGLEFTLDKDASVASASGDIFSGTKPGTTQTSVTASSIGTDSNLPSGTKFAINNNNALAAKNDDAFSGGSKKSVTVVSKDDIAKLKKDLPKNLEGKANDSLSQKANSGQTILQGISETTLDNITIDKKAGDEAKQVKINATVVFTGVAYQQDELLSFSQSLLKSKYSEGGDFASNSIKNTLTNIKQKDDTDIQASLSAQAGLIPKLNTNDIIKQLQNKSLKQAQNTLSTIPQVTNSEIKFSPNIPLLPNLFPRLPGNITVVIQSN